MKLPTQYLAFLALVLGGIWLGQIAVSILGVSTWGDNILIRGIMFLAPPSVGYLVYTRFRRRAEGVIGQGH